MFTLHCSVCTGGGRESAAHTKVRRTTLVPDNVAMMAAAALRAGKYVAVTVTRWWRPLRRFTDTVEGYFADKGGCFVGVGRLA